MNYRFSQIKLSLHLVSITTFLNLSGCAHQVDHEELVAKQLALDSPRYFSHASLQNKFHREGGWDTKTQTIGLALAGGGTKAADFSLGVIQGLDEKGIMSDVDVISTVSGGSYAGLWYFARHWLDHEYAVNQVIYKDCLPSNYASKLEDKSRLSLLEVCPSFNHTNYEPSNDDIYRYQNYLRGYQDIFSSGTDIFGRKAFNYQFANEPSRMTNDIGQLVTKSLGASVLNIIPNIVFDWEIPISPSRIAYGHGIARTFGATPPSCKENGCGDERNLDPDSKSESFRAEGDISPVKKFSFKDLQSLTEQHKLPLWIINSTAGEDRSPWDFTAQAEPEKTVFEFTPYGYGSGIYSYHEGVLSDINPLDAVKSSAAFLDSQQKSTFSLLVRKLFVAPLMDVLTLNWGRSYINPNVSSATVAFHHMLPWPLYYLHRFNAGSDSAFIHLSDGGQSENLGAYSLVRRGVDTLIISDHAYDRGGRMGDVCRLKNELHKVGYSLVLPGLADLDKVCSDKKEGYDIFHWQHPVMLGCIVANSDHQDCKELPNHWDRESGKYFARVFIIKPAFANDELSEALQNVSIAARKSDKEGAEFVRNICLAQQGFKTKTPWKFEGGLSCEILLFTYNNGFAEENLNGKDDCPQFPQYSTVSMTLNSSPWMYGVSRELGYYYSRQLDWFYVNNTLNTAHFSAALEYQAKNPMHPVSSPGGTLEAPKAGKPDDCLGFGVRPEQF
jgi:hypothetical protein